MTNEIKIEKVEQFDPSYHIEALVSDMLEAGLISYENTNLYIAKIKGKEDKIRVQVSLRISSNVSPEGAFPAE